jgi:hypothetical protein
MCGRPAPIGEFSSFVRRFALSSPTPFVRRFYARTVRRSFAYTVGIWQTVLGCFQLA